MRTDVPETIVCVDCGGVAHRLTPEPADGFSGRDIVAFRCVDCLDRWDLVFDDQDVT